MCTTKAYAELNRSPPCPGGGPPRWPCRTLFHPLHSRGIGYNECSHRKLLQTSSDMFYKFDARYGPAGLWYSAFWVVGCLHAFGKARSEMDCDSSPPSFVYSSSLCLPVLPLSTSHVHWKAVQEESSGWKPLVKFWQSFDTDHRGVAMFGWSSGCNWGGLSC